MDCVLIRIKTKHFEENKIETQIDYCIYRTSGLFSEYEWLQATKGVRGKAIVSKRPARQSGYSFGDEDLNAGIQA